MKLLQFNGRRLSVKTATKPVPPWPALELEVHPACPADILQHEAAVKAAGDDPAKAVRANAEFFARHVAGWSATVEAAGGDGVVRTVPAPVSPDTVASLPLPVFNQLYDIVCGFFEESLGNSAPSSGSSPAPGAGSAPAPTAGG